jgi:hypothetical protein
MTFCFEVMVVSGTRISSFLSLKRLPENGNPKRNPDNMRIDKIKR